MPSPKPNRKPKRTIRACAARGRALKRTGSPVAASRLARYCPPPGRRKKNAAAGRKAAVSTGQFYDMRVFAGGTWAARLAAATKFQELVRRQMPGVYAMVVETHGGGMPSGTGDIRVSMVEWPDGKEFGAAVMRHLRSLDFED